MKGKIKVFVAVELTIVLVFGIVSYTMFRSLSHKYSNGSNRIEREYSCKLIDEYSMNRYCMENGLEPFNKKSPGDILNECVGTFINNSTESGWVEGTYIIAKCYDKDKKLIAEAGDIISITFIEDDKFITKYTYPDKYFSKEQMQEIYSFIEKYGNARISKVEGYYEGDELVLTAIEVTSSRKEGLDVLICNKTDKETVVYDDNTEEINGIYDTFLKTQAAERPVYYHGDGLVGVIDYLIEKYEASRSKQIQKYNEAQFENRESGSVEWLEGTEGITNEQTFLYEGEAYSLVYSVMTDWNYVAMADSWLSLILARIFYFLQAAAIICSILIYKVYQKKKRLEYAKVVLTNGVAHELKTPLAVIKNYGECIEAQVNPEKNSYYVSSILSETDRMNAMVVQLLNYTRFSNEEYKIKKELFALDELAVEVLKERQEAIRQKCLNITFHCEGNMEVICDGALIKMVIDNYLTNAISHTPEHQNIHISIEELQSRFQRRLTCKVYNQGSFISMEERSYIWDVFYRGDKARNRKGNSTGFGLAICKHIIRLHKGKYGCIDKVNGIEFFFTLPAGGNRKSY